MTRALASRRESKRILEAIVALDPARTNDGVELTGVYFHIAMLRQKTDDATTALAGFRNDLSFLESLADKHPQHQTLRATLALAYSNLANAHAQIAANPKPTKYLTSSDTARTEYWRQARIWHERSLEIYTDLERRDLLPDEFHKTRPAAIKLELARGDAALGRSSSSDLTQELDQLHTRR